MTGWTGEGGDVSGEGGGDGRLTEDSASKSDGVGIVGSSVKGDGGGGIAGAGSESIGGAWRA